MQIDEATVAAITRAVIAQLSGATPQAHTPAAIESRPEQAGAPWETVIAKVCRESGVKMRALNGDGRA